MVAPSLPQPWLPVPNKNPPNQVFRLSFSRTEKNRYWNLEVIRLTDCSSDMRLFTLMDNITEVKQNSTLAAFQTQQTGLRCCENGQSCFFPVVLFIFRPCLSQGDAGRPPLIFWTQILNKKSNLKSVWYGDWLYFYQSSPLPLFCWECASSL